MVAESRQTQLESRLTRLWFEAEEIVSRWQSKVIWLVEGSVGLHPFNSEEKAHDSKGRLINIRILESDDDFDSYYRTLSLEFANWNEDIDSWLSDAPPRFRRRFDEVLAKAERFSERFDGRYTYAGEIPALLDLYDDFYKKRAAIKDLWDKFGSGSWSIRGNNGIAFKLIYDDMNRNLCIEHMHIVYKIQHFRYDSNLEQALEKAFDKEHKEHIVKMNANCIQNNISMLRIPQKLRRLMITASKTRLVINPRITYGDLKNVGIDVAEIAEELERTCPKIASSKITSKS